MGDDPVSVSAEPNSRWRGFSPRFSEMSSLGMAGIGLSIAVGYLLLHVAFDALFLALWGFPEGELPLWQNDQW